MTVAGWQAYLEIQYTVRSSRATVMHFATFASSTYLRRIDQSTCVSFCGSRVQLQLWGTFLGAHRGVHLCATRHHALQRPRRHSGLALRPSPDAPHDNRARGRRARLRRCRCVRCRARRRAVPGAAQRRRLRPLHARHRASLRAQHQDRWESYRKRPRRLNRPAPAGLQRQLAVKSWHCVA